MQWGRFRTIIYTMFSDPVKNVKALGLHEDDIVADLGAGAGYYAVAAGGIVSRGRVYAVEVVRELLSTIKSKVRDAHLSNIEVIWGNLEKLGGSKIRDTLADAVIASNILFQVEDRAVFIDEVKRILKPQGRVLLVDWSEASPGVSVDLVIPKGRAQAMFEEKGFALGREIDAGAHHYGMIMIKS
jgi:ubiquinone/menaquinone biosynthesis C-methylase UbiE